MCKLHRKKTDSTGTENNSSVKIWHMKVVNELPESDNV